MSIDDGSRRATLGPASHEDGSHRNRNGPGATNTRPEGGSSTTDCRTMHENAKQGLETSATTKTSVSTTDAIETNGESEGERHGIRVVCLSCDFEAVWSPEDRARHLHDLETEHEVAYESVNDRVRCDGGEPVGSTGGGRHAPYMGGSTTGDTGASHFCDVVGSTVYAPRRRCPYKCYDDGDDDLATDGGRDEVETTSSMWYCPLCETWVGRKLGECVSEGHSRPRFPVLYEDVDVEDARDVTRWDQLKAVFRGVVR